MRHLIRVFVPLIALGFFVRFYFENTPGMQPTGKYPVWIRDINDNQTNQTSGLFFVGILNGKKNFISCDDIGKVNRIEIDESGDEVIPFISPIHYSDTVKAYFAKFKKTDMEEIMFDVKSGKILISIEGHEYSSDDPMIYRKKEGIYEFGFNKDINTFDTLTSIRRLDFPEEIYNYTYDNIGFEGFSATENYFFIGLENFQKGNEQFTDSTLLYVVDRSTGELVTVPTRELGISSISGLHALNDRVVYGIDRNMTQMFRLEFDDLYNVTGSERLKLDLHLRGHKDMSVIPGIAPESIAIDDEGFIFVAIDPWLQFYKPDLAQRKLLSEEDLFNFRKEVPLLYKFNNEFR